MASNFRNSAGTDLDNLFYVGNSNLGAIGFKMSNGVDLGNRYASGSLGYNVGYKNSAGTDIGYLRGRVYRQTVSLYVGKQCDEDGYCSYGYSYWGRYGSVSGTVLGASVYRIESWGGSTYFELDSSVAYKRCVVTIGSSSASFTFDSVGWQGVSGNLLSPYVGQTIPVHFDFNM